MGQFTNLKQATHIHKGWQQAKHTFSLILIVLTHFLAVVSWAQNIDPQSIHGLARLDSLEERANYYSENHPIEKVYVHFDKPFYVLGEESWYKAYVVSGSDLNPTDISSVLHLDWIDPAGNIIRHQRFKIENGSAAGDFTIDKKLREGTYTVRAYTNWMRNEDKELFYSKRIPVFSANKMQSASSNDTAQSNIDLQFFPEGGALVEGIKTQIAFKAIDIHGRGIDVKGQIVDEQNNFITTFHSTHNGMGIFPFIAHADKSYRVVLQHGETYPLPLPSGQGLVLAASNINASKLLVRIQASEKYESSAAYLIGHSHGSICYAAHITMDKNVKDVSISKDELPEGILQLTLFDSEGIPQCERMVFVKKDNKMVVTITGEKEEYAPRDSVILNFSVQDTKGNPVETLLSVSVTDASFVSAHGRSENIYTRLLLQSDLKGIIERPGWYFESQTAERTYALDLVMLTHGWSRYNWKKILSPTTDSILFMPEKGIAIEGQILAHNKPVANAPFTLMIPQSENDFFNIYETDSLGHFIIPSLDFSDSTMFSWRVMSGKKGKVQNAELHLDAPHDIPPVTRYGRLHQTREGSKDELLEKLIARFIKTGMWSLDNITTLDEVVVEAQRMKIKVIGNNTIAVKPSPEDLKGLSSTFVNRYVYGLSGARLVTLQDGTDIWTTQQGAPIAISIDGIMQENTGLGANPFAVINSIPIEQIGFVVISEGMISIVTKNETAQEGPGTIKRLVKGYDGAREFYHPRYGPSDIFSTGADYRITLYWNANLQTGKDGTARVKFYNTDTTQKFLIVAEGIANGLTISTTKILGED